MKPGGGQPKGGQFERDMCRRLSLWVTGGESADIFWRTPSSGGRATIQLRAGTVNVMQSGDICAVDPRGYPFVQANYVELKHYKDLGISRSVVCGTGLLANFWRKARLEACRYSKQPLLIARQNFYPTLAIVETENRIFQSEPLIILCRWGAVVYLFDEATAVQRKLTRRAN